LVRPEIWEKSLQERPSTRRRSREGGRERTKEKEEATKSKSISTLFIVFSAILPILGLRREEVTAGFQGERKKSDRIFEKGKKQEKEAQTPSKIRETN